MIGTQRRAGGEGLDREIAGDSEASRGATRPTVTASPRTSGEQLKAAGERAGQRAGAWRLRCLRLSTTATHYPVDVRVSPHGTATAHYEDGGTLTFHDLAHLFVHHDLDLEDFREVHVEPSACGPKGAEQVSTILIVDRDRAIREVLAEVLEASEPYRVLTAETLAHGRRMFGKLGPDVLLIDLPPHPDAELGWLAELKTQFEGTLLVMSTDARCRQIASRMGVPFLSKPFDLEELLGRLRAPRRAHPRLALKLVRAISKAQPSHDPGASSSALEARATRAVSPPTHAAPRGSGTHSVARAGSRR